MHTDATVDHLRLATEELAECLRNINGALETLPSKGHRKTKVIKDGDRKQGQKGKKKEDTAIPRPVFNRNTVKLHFLGDYARTILRLGSTDSYSTSLVRVLYIL